MSLIALNALKDKSVFVTGHTGFKGSWLCLWLARLGAKVTGYALAPPTDPNNFTQSGVRNVLDGHHEADIRDQATLQAAMLRANPDVVLHLAAQSIVRKSYRVPRETFDVNVIGTIDVLEAVRGLNRPVAVVCVTSDKCYENVEQVWGYRESDAFGDHDPYGASKGAAEIAIRSYRHSFFPTDRLADHGVKLASARAGNVVGGGDWTPDALIVDIVKSLVNGEAIPLRNPNAFRPWQHVLQALSGYLTLAERLLTSDDPALCSGWNFGPRAGGEIPVHRVVDQFVQHWGSGSWIDVGDPDQPPEANILRLSIDKALWQIGWKPGWSVEETLARTATWYQHYFDAANRSTMREVCLDQIAEYESILTQNDSADVASSEASTVDA